MPQLDQITFLSQFFWLCFFYLSFYFLILKYFLPKMSRILKFRKTLLNSSQEGFNSVHIENDKVRTNYELFLSKGLNTSRTAFTDSFQQFDKWLNTTLTTTNENHSQTMNKAYIHSVGESSLSQNLALTLLSTVYSDKLFVSRLAKKLKNPKGFVFKTTHNFSTTKTTKLITPKTTESSQTRQKEILKTKENEKTNSLKKRKKN
jgi:Plant ATP synthase F0